MFVLGAKSALFASLSLATLGVSAEWIPAVPEPLRLIVWGSFLLSCSVVVNAICSRSDQPRTVRRQLSRQAA
jgi:hypothetical protein